MAAALLLAGTLLAGAALGAASGAAMPQPPALRALLVRSGAEAAPSLPLPPRPPRTPPPPLLPRAVASAPEAAPEAAVGAGTSETGGPSLAPPAPEAPPPAASPAWGRLVVLGVRCGERPPAWGERLDIALGDVLRAADGENGLRSLAATELAAAHEWQKNPAAACATLERSFLAAADALVAAAP